MSHSFGSASVPFSPIGDGGPIGDPAIDILAEALPPILVSWCGDSWSSVAPSEPLVRKVFRHDPTREEFSEKDLPALYVFRSQGKPLYETDDHAALQSQIHCLWLFPPATQDKRARRGPFFAQLAKAYTLLTQNERDPAWIREGDTTDASLAYGSPIAILAGFDRWWVEDVAHADLDVRGVKYPGVLARLQVVESSTTDPVVYPGVGPSRVDTKIGPAPDDDTAFALQFRDPPPP